MTKMKKMTKNDKKIFKKKILTKKKWPEWPVKQSKINEKLTDDQPTDQPTNGPTDIAAYRVA